MKKLTRSLVLGLLVLLALPGARAQRHRDPLTEAEIDLLREVSPEPARKLKLYVQFAHTRMDLVERARADGSLSPKQRGQKVHAALQDLSDLVDEISRNLESFGKRGDDMRKPLREVISMDGDFQARLGTLKHQAAAPEQAEEFAEYQYVLDDALDSVKGNNDLAHDLLEEQNQAAERKKHQKK